MSKFKMTAALIAFASVAGLSTSSFASDDVFHFDRAELSYDAGVKATLERIDYAATSRCTHNGRVGLWQKRLENECIADLKEEMIEKIGDSRLTAAAEGSVFVSRR